MALVRFFQHLPRVFVMGAVVWWFLLRYLVLRVGTLFVARGEARRTAVAHLRGRTLRMAFAALGANFVKLGQVLSTRPDLLDPEIIAELRKLQDKLPPFAFDRARRILEEDLGKPVAEVFAEFDERPVAAASVAQVHRARLTGGAEVAVKILRPDVRRKVERDSAILLLLARVAAWHPRLRLSDPVGHIRHFEKGILDQTDLTLEADNYERFRANFSGFAGIRFPRVHRELSAARVMTMEFVRGAKLDALSGGDHKHLAARLQQTILKMCFVDAFVHADLHPGNLVLDDAGDLVIFDVGLVKHLDADLLDQFTDFTRCLVMGTPLDFVTHIRKFHHYVTAVDWDALQEDLGAFIKAFRRQNVGELEIGGMFNEIYALARRYRVRPLPDMILVMVGIVTAEGIGKQLNPDNNLFESVAAYLMPILAAKGALPQISVSSG